jgi:hypothetical protein
MAGSEKRSVLMARGQALRRRAMELVDRFTSPAVREHLELVALRIEEELDWLDEQAEPALPKVPQFLPETTLSVMLLADLLRAHGPDAPLPFGLKGRLDGRRAEG